MDVSFAEGSFLPSPAGRSVAYSQVSTNLYGTLDIEYTKHRKLCLGGGISFAGTTKDVRQDGMTVQLTPQQSDESSFDPMLVLQDVEGWVFVSAAWMPTRSAGRLDIGMVFGR